MKSSQNSASTPSKQLDTKTFTIYGMTFMYHVATTHVDEWKQQLVKDAEGNPTKVVGWERTGEVIKTQEVTDAVIKDDDRCEVARPVYLYSTADGPILGIALKNTDDHVVLLDPCIVVYDGTGRIQLFPIFGVSRTLTVYRTAIRTQQPPAELLLAAYPNFLIQNRMFLYQLRPKVPFAVTPELTNDGT